MKKKLICALLAGCMAISPATMSFAAETELATDAASGLSRKQLLRRFGSCHGSNL
ncbi:MAG: hypothetical protein ACLU3N_05525 [Lachnospiraceae bacterium]